MAKEALNRSPYADVKGHLSALMLLPYFDKFRCTVFDAMHNLLQGNDKTYLWKCLCVGKYGTVNEPDNDNDSEVDSTDGELFPEPIVRPTFNPPLSSTIAPALSPAVLDDSMTLEEAMAASQASAEPSTSMAPPRPPSNPPLSRPTRVNPTRRAKEVLKPVFTPANLVAISQAIRQVWDP